jgi:hypothetical protein
MAGFFPSVPTQVNFELLYAPVGGRWRLFGLSVSFGQAAPAAPQPPAAAPPQEKVPQAQAPPPEVRQEAAVVNLHFFDEDTHSGRGGHNRE